MKGNREYKLAMAFLMGAVVCWVALVVLLILEGRH